MFKTLIISLLSAAWAIAQTEPAPTKTIVQVGGMAGPVGITTALAGPMSNVTGAPYSAQTTTERIQVLADGNRIVQSTSGSVARDSRGRTRREESLPGLKESDGQPSQLVMIDDPVAQVHWTLNPQTKTATKMQIPNIKSGPFGLVARSGMGPGNTFFFTAAAPASSSVSIMSAGPLSKENISSNEPNVVKTDLGTQKVEGVLAQGTRMARTFPAGGELGNELPLTITTETWYSPDLKVLVLSKSSDPRMGDTTYRLTNVQRSEPAANLFQVPEDYTVKDAPVPTVRVQDR
jgi:hypothetical protein